MIADVLTMAWKEWRELFAAQGGRRSALMNFVLVVGVLGIFMPLQFGRAWVDSPAMLLYWAWLPLFMLANIVVDAFAGERERHTLETLLATRLPDQAILLGKIGAAAAYALTVTMACLGLGLLTVNLAFGSGSLILYPRAMLAAAILANALVAVLIASLGVLVSIRAGTVRQAGQIMGIAVLAIAFGPVGLARLLATRYPGWHVPPEWAATAAVVTVALVVLFDVGLVAAAVARFQRAKLLLD